MEWVQLVHYSLTFLGFCIFKTQEGHTVGRKNAMCVCVSHSYQKRRHVQNILHNFKLHLLNVKSSSDDIPLNSVGIVPLSLFPANNRWSQTRKKSKISMRQNTRRQQKQNIAEYTLCNFDYAEEQSNRFLHRQKSFTNDS